MKTQGVPYQAGALNFEGYASYPQGGSDLLAVVVLHDWHGLNQFSKDVADRSARAGFFAFAPNLFGVGIRPESNDAAAANAAIYLTNRNFLRQRLALAVSQLQAFVQIDQSKFFSIGYSFGAPVAIELSQLDVRVAKTAIFWGALGAPSIDVSPHTRFSYLVLEGALDPYATPADVNKLEAKLKASGASYRLETFENGMHAFGHPYAGDLSAYGVKYDAALAEQGWQSVESFFKQ